MNLANRLASQSRLLSSSCWRSGSARWRVGSLAALPAVRWQAASASAAAAAAAAVERSLSTRDLGSSMTAPKIGSLLLPPTASIVAGLRRKHSGGAEGAQNASGPSTHKPSMLDAQQAQKVSQMVVDRLPLIQVRSDLEALSDSTDRLTWAEWAELCRKHRLSDGEAREALQVLCDAGVVLHVQLPPSVDGQHQDASNVRDLVLLRPEHLVRQLSALLRLHLPQDQASIESELQQAQEQLQQICAKESSAERKAAFRANLTLLSGLGVVSAQFAVLAWATWWEYSWDIIEPISYFLGLFNVILALLFYIATKNQFSFEYVRNSVMNKHTALILNDIEAHQRRKEHLIQRIKDLTTARQLLLPPLEQQQQQQQQQ